MSCLQLQESISEKISAFIFRLDYRGITFFRNVSKHLPDYTTSQPRRLCNLHTHLLENLKSYNLVNFEFCFHPLHGVCMSVPLLYLVKMKQEVLGRTKRLLSLLRQRPHRRRRAQQFFYCCVCICCRGNVFTEPLRSKNKVIHIQTHRLMGGIYEVRR
jgi:hypothetical protein